MYRNVLPQAWFKGNNKTKCMIRNNDHRSNRSFTKEQMIYRQSFNYIDKECHVMVCEDGVRFIGLHRYYSNKGILI